MKVPTTLPDSRRRVNFECGRVTDKLHTHCPAQVRGGRRGREAQGCHQGCAGQRGSQRRKAGGWASLGQSVSAPALRLAASPPSGAPSLGAAWYSSYAASRAGKRAKLEKYLQAGGGDARDCSLITRELVPLRGSADQARGPRWGSLSYHFQQVWSLQLPQRNICRPFKFVLMHSSREKGRAGPRTEPPLQCRPQFILRAGWCPALPLTAAASPQQEFLFIARVRLFGLRIL